jgi:hypothetical protein
VCFFCIANALNIIIIGKYTTVLLGSSISGAAMGFQPRQQQAAFQNLQNETDSLQFKYAATTWHLLGALLLLSPVYHVSSQAAQREKKTAPRCVQHFE